MATTYTLISSNVLTGSQATVTFSSIPSTYTDLVLKYSARGDAASTDRNMLMQVSGLTAGFSATSLSAAATSVSTTRNAATTEWGLGQIAAGTAAANMFSSGEVYLPNYTSSTYKPNNSFTARESNSATDYYIVVTANLLNNTTTISSILLYPASGNFVSGSSFYLYGIKNA